MNSIGISFALASLLQLFSPQIYAQDASAPLNFDERVASPLTLVPPNFPKSIVDPVKIKIGVKGIVHSSGIFEVLDMEQSENNAEFVREIMEVLKYWRFIPATDKENCVPRDQNFNIILEFEGTTKEPHVYLSLSKENAGRGVANWGPKIEGISAPPINYPEKLLGVEGEVNVLLLVSPSGDVEKATILSSTPYGAFDKAVLANARRTHVRWKPPGVSASQCASRSYLFCMSGWSKPKLEYGGCRKSE